jgi:hypothetical protein
MVGTALPNRIVLDRTLVRMCCHCRRVWTLDGWQHESVPPEVRVTHGICRGCYVTHYPEFGPPPDEN